MFLLTGSTATRTSTLIFSIICWLDYSILNMMEMSTILWMRIEPLWLSKTTECIVIGLCELTTLLMIIDETRIQSIHTLDQTSCCFRVKKVKTAIHIGMCGSWIFFMRGFFILINALLSPLNHSEWNSCLCAGLAVIQADQVDGRITDYIVLAL